MTPEDLTYTASAPRAGEAQVTREGDAWVVRAMPRPGEHSCACCAEPVRLVVGVDVFLTREASGRWRAVRMEPRIALGCIVDAPDPAPWEAP